MHALAHVILSLSEMCHPFAHVRLWILFLFKWLTHVRHCPCHQIMILFYSIIVLFYITLFGDDLHLPLLTSLPSELLSAMSFVTLLFYTVQVFQVC